MEEMMNNNAIEEIEVNEVNDEVVAEENKVNVKKIAIIAGSVIGGGAALYGIYRGVKALRESEKLQAKIKELKAETEKEIEKAHEAKEAEKEAKKSGENEPRNREERRAQAKQNKK